MCNCRCRGEFRCQFRPHQIKAKVPKSIFKLHFILSIEIFSETLFRASENTSSASNGRLNNDVSAWCFSYETISAQKVTFTVDLGSLHLVLNVHHSSQTATLYLSHIYSCYFACVFGEFQCIFKELIYFGKPTDQCKVLENASQCGKLISNSDLLIYLCQCNALIWVAQN